MNTLNLFIVSLYKLIGFVVLTAILVGLVSYMSLNVYYLLDSNWLTPAILSPSDSRVLQVGAQLAEYSSQREKLTAERAEVGARLQDLQRIVATQRGFQRSFQGAVRADLAAREQDLGRLRQLGTRAQGARGEIERSRQAYSGMSRRRLDDLFKARLIDNEQLVAGNFQLSQLAHSNLSLAKDDVSLETQEAVLQREIESLRSLVGGKGAGGAISYEVLHIRQEYEKSLLDASRAADDQDALKHRIVAIDRGIAEYDDLLRATRKSPFLKATRQNLTVALVPYDNLDHMPKGTPLYGCYLGIVWCRRVGQIVEHLPGEVTMNHPLHNHLLRGVMAQVDLDDNRWAEQRVLFARRLLF